MTREEAIMILENNRPSCGERIIFKESEVYEAISMAIDALSRGPCEDAVSRKAAIDVEGLDEEIRCEMCKNPMNTDRGCNGNCKYDEKLYEKIIQILDKRIKLLPSAQPDHLREPTKMMERRTGRWYDVGSLSCRCSACGCKSQRESMFCPNCGADMRGEQNE